MTSILPLVSTVTSVKISQSSSETLKFLDVCSPPGKAAHLTNKDGVLQLFSKSWRKLELTRIILTELVSEDVVDNQGPCCSFYHLGSLAFLRIRRSLGWVSMWLDVLWSFPPVPTEVHPIWLNTSWSLCLSLVSLMKKTPIPSSALLEERSLHCHIESCKSLLPKILFVNPFRVLRPAQ